MSHKLTLGQLIRKKRKVLGLTQTELGQKIGLSTSTISRCECGYSKGTNIINLKLLAEALMMSPNEIAMAIKVKKVDDVTNGEL